MRLIHTSTRVIETLGSCQPSLNSCMTSGIYTITCRANGKFYVGSAVNIQKRWQTHRSHLKMNRHVNKHLQNAWNKYGEKTFKFSVVEQTLPEKLIEAEQRWIDAVSPDVLFNICLVAGSLLGHKCSEETRQKISKANAGRVLSTATRQKISDALHRRIVLDETRQKHSEANRKRIVSDETRLKQSKAKFSNTNGKGRNSGFLHSEETRQKISVAAKCRWAMKHEVA